MSAKDKEMELLSAYLDEELEETEQKRVGAFLANSANARAELERLRHTKNLFIGTPKIKAPVDFLDAIERQAEQYADRYEARKSWNWGGRWGFASAVFAACFMLALGIRLFPTTQKIPLNALLAAHNAQSASGIHQNLMSVSHIDALRNENNKA